MMKKSYSLLLVFGILGGCTTIKPVEPPVVYKEPVLVGEPFGIKIAKSKKEISDQIALLDTINKKRFAGKYQMLVHNNNLDARAGSSRTVPESYNKASTSNGYQVLVNDNNNIAPKESSVRQGKIIKNLDWKDSSLNDLINGFSSATNYEVVINNSKSKNVSFSASQEDSFSALNRLANEVSSFATIQVVDREKKIYLTYK